jgi:putative ABC transport system ATP-binding protein
MPQRYTEKHDGEMDEKSTIVEIKNLSKSYRRGAYTVLVLQNVTFDIKDQEFLSIMGPSGSGKSTLLNLIAGIDKADSGTVTVGGVEVTSLSETELAQWRATHVGFIFQFYNLIPVLTAIENTELPLHLTGLSKRERQEHARMALRLVNLEHRMDHYPRQLSGGEQQRVAIARAIVTDPTILVADEPTGDLDRASAEEVLDLMGRLNAELGKTIIMVTHDPRAAKRASITRNLEKGLLNDAHS